MPSLRNRGINCSQLHVKKKTSARALDELNFLATVVPKVDNGIYWINHYPADKH